MTEPLTVARDPENPARSIERQRLCYVHVPRVVNEYFHLLAGLYPSERRLSIGEYRQGIGAWTPAKVQSGWFFAGQFRLSEAQDVLHTDAHYVTFLQRPADRLAAEFVLSLSPDEMTTGSAAPSGRSAFLDWLDRDGPPPDSYRANLQTWILGAPTNSADLGMDPEALSHEDLRALLARAKRHLIDDLSFFGLAEHYLASLHLFCWTFGLRPDAFDHAVGAHDEPARVVDLVDDAAGRLVADRSWADVELHEFALRQFQKRHLAMLREIEQHGAEPDAPPLLAGAAIELRAGADLTPLHGCHQLEETPDGTCWYWTGARSSAAFLIPIDLSWLEHVGIEIEARAASNPVAWDELVPLLDGRPMRVISRGHRNGKLHLAAVGTPSTHRDGDHELELFGPLFPSTAPTDERQLGLAIERVSLTATIAPDAASAPRAIEIDPSPPPGRSQAVDLASRLERAARRRVRALVAMARRAAAPGPADARSGRGATTVAAAPSLSPAEGSTPSSSTAGPSFADLGDGALADELAATRQALADVWETRELLRNTAIRATDLAVRFAAGERPAAVSAAEDVSQPASHR